MAKIRRRTISTDGIRKVPPARKSILPYRLRKLIPFIRQPEPAQEEVNPEVVAGQEETIEPTGDPNPTQSTTTTGSAGSTDPGTASSSTTTNDMEPMIGEIRMFAGNFAPRGWAFCNGQLLNITQYPALYSILGTVYGGDGRTDFALPDLRGRVSVHPGQGDGLTSRSLGAKGGTESVVLNNSEIPAHNHNVRCSNNSANAADPENNTIASGNLAFVDNSSGDKYMNSGMIENTGGNLPHSNMQPFLAINYIIAVEGIFPARS